MAVMLIATPFMEPQAVAEQPSEVTFCNCCDGPCQGCCCAMPESNDQDDSEQHDDACTCDFAPAQPAPQVPVTAVQHQVEIQVTPDEPVAITHVIAPESESRAVVLGSHSPPVGALSPSYILFGALLI